jgi:hypothetical protein
VNALAKARFLKPAIIAIIALDLVALVAFSVRVDNVTRTTTTPAATSVPAILPAAPATAAAVPVAVPPPAPQITTTTGGGSTTTASGPTKTTAPSPPPLSGTPTTGTGSEPEPADCPLPLAKPVTSGGLQSLIDFAPAFGPFSAEAFAAASAYQPALQLIGPILAQYPKIAPTIEPAMTPFLNAFAGILNTGYTLLAPIYTPYRQRVLEAETTLATAIAPYAEKLVSSPLGGCVIDLEAALVGDTAPTSSSSPSTTPAVAARPVASRG